MSDERLERIEKRLDEIAELLRELVEMARRDWEIYQAALNSAPPSRAFEQTWRAKGRFAEAMKAAAAGSAAYVQGTNAYTDYLKERFGEAEYKPVSIGEEHPIWRMSGRREKTPMRMKACTTRAERTAWPRFTRQKRAKARK